MMCGVENRGRAGCVTPAIRLEEPGLLALSIVTGTLVLFGLQCHSIDSNGWQLKEEKELWIAYVEG